MTFFANVTYAKCHGITDLQGWVLRARHALSDSNSSAKHHNGHAGRSTARGLSRSPAAFLFRRRTAAADSLVPGHLRPAVERIGPTLILVLSARAFA